MLNFLELQNRMLRWIDEINSTATVSRDRVKESLNASHRRVYYSQPWPWTMWPNEESFTTVAGVRAYALNPALGKVRTLWDPQVRDFTALIPRREWQTMGVDRTRTGVTPVGWTMGPVWPVGVQPTTTGVLSFVSDDATDTSTNECSVALTGISSGGIQVSETITPTGTTPVTSTFSYSHVLSLGKSGTWAGTLTVSDAAATTLLTLYASEDARDYPTIEATETPAAGLVYKYTFQRRPRTMVEDGDLPETKPNECAEIHVYDALIDETTYNTEIGGSALPVWTKRFQQLETQLQNTNDEAIVGSYPRMVRDIGLVRYVTDPSVT